MSVPVKGFTDYSISEEGKVFSNKRKPKQLKVNSVGGYAHVRLYLNGKGYDRKVHRLVAEHFIDNPESKLEVNHKDGDTSNNHKDNLEWSTRLENMKHAYENNLVPFMEGEKNGMAVLNDKQIKEIREKYIPRKYSCRKLSKEYGVSPTKICQIVNNKAWRHI